MDFPSPEILSYASQFTTQEPPLLASLNRETWSKVLMPRMLSGHIQGRILSLFSHMIKPSRILEIGTYTGYSAICLAEGLSKDGQLHTIDINEELEDMVRHYFESSPYAHQLHFHLGNALNIVPTLDESWDLVFIDADKENYINYFDLIINRVRSGGIILADNVLWSGKVLQPTQQMDAETLALHGFNQYVAQDPRVEALLFPVRDGLMCLRKI